MFFLAKSKLTAASFRLSIICFLIAFNSTGLADEDEQEIQHPPNTVHLDEQQLKNSGIRTQNLPISQYTPELIAYGSVLNIQALLEIQSHLSIANANYLAAKADSSQARHALKRLQNLHDNQAISTRKLQIQQKIWRSSKNLLDTTRLQKETLQQTLRLNWGEKLSNDYSHIASITSGLQVLLSVSLSANKTLSQGTEIIFVHPSGDRKKAIVAKFLSAALQTDQFSQGESYFFLAANTGLIAGMRITAWIPQTRKLTGVIIPETSLLWHLGQAFVYLETQPQTFTRHTISGPVKSPTGFFVLDPVLVGKKIVVTGAQTLLSEEFRSQIPDEDDD
jgi:hypothetical protein